MSEVLATVAGKEITRDDFNKFMERMPEQQRAYFSGPEAEAFYIDQLIEMTLFAEYGKAEKLDETEDFQKQLAEFVRDTLARAVMKQIFEGVEVSEAEAKAFYDENQDKFQKDELVHAKHILVDEEERCQEIKDEIINENRPFEDAAASYSKCPSSAQGGDLGEFGRGRMVSEFEEAAFSGNPGDIIGPVKTQFGYHLIKVMSHKGLDVAPFSEVKEHIYKDLLQQKQEQVYLAKVEELKKVYM